MRHRTHMVHTDIFLKILFMSLLLLLTLLFILPGTPVHGAGVPDSHPTMIYTVDGIVLENGTLEDSKTDAADDSIEP